MFKRILAVWTLASLTLATQAQGKIAFKEEVFTKLSCKKNITYSQHIPAGIKTKFYKLDLYQPLGDTNSARPLIIWMHGGGFKFGSKRAKNIRLWCKSFARRGYVCASINYRLSKKNPLRNFEALVRGCYEAIHDVEQAVKFFKSNHAQYGIDTSYIILAGNSAGAIVALQAVYSNTDDLIPLMNFSDSTAVIPGYNSNNVAAVINFWGALFNVSWLQNTRVPIVSVHGRRDRIIPYGQKNSQLYGSSIIHKKADSLEIPNRLKTYDRFGHELQKHFIPILRSGATKRRWLEAGQFAANFLYLQFWNK
jgi:acetyl esterase/lipase